MVDDKFHTKRQAYLDSYDYKNEISDVYRSYESILKLFGCAHVVSLSALLD
jgi:hypothetical protein